MRVKLISRWSMFPLLILVLMCSVAFSAFSAEVFLKPIRPDSLRVMADGNNVRVRWYPPSDSAVSVIGTVFYNSWKYKHESDGVNVEFFGTYTGSVDRYLTISLMDNSTYEVGASTTIPILLECTDKFWKWDKLTEEYVLQYDTYSKTIDIGNFGSEYGDTIPVILRGGDPFREIDLGFSIYFNNGKVDTTATGLNAFLSVDLQTFEGFHVWRKEVIKEDPEYYPSQDTMVAIGEISKEQFHLYSKIKRIDEVPNKQLENWEYFTDYGYEAAYPRIDSVGTDRKIYYEWVDDNVFPGNKYFYSVTSYDRGYYKGASKDSVIESFVCDNDSINCKGIMKSIWVGSPYTGKMIDIYAVPNPFRTGSSAQTTPYYHNYDDGNYVKFYNIPMNAKLRIFTVAGDLVWKAELNDRNNGEGIIKWDGRNMEGKKVSSGIFIYRCEDVSGADTYGKLIVIR